MATLTLKKPTKIGETPLKDLHHKFVVMRQSRNDKSFRFTVYHDTFELAKKEATRLSKMYQTERFLVLQVQDWAQFNQESEDAKEKMRRLRSEFAEKAEQERKAKYQAEYGEIPEEAEEYFAWCKKQLGM